MSFDAAEPGTDTATWCGDDRLRSLSPLDLTAVTALMVIAAHPDDETLGVGGLIALANERQIPVTVIVATDGAASHPASSDERLIELRLQRAAETRSALRVLNPAARVIFLDLPDGQTRENRDHLRSELRPLLASAPAGTLAVVPWRGDGHRDHRVVGEVAVEIADDTGIELLEYPIWMWHWGTPDAETIPWSRMVELRLSEEASERKCRALDEFHSQVDPVSGSPAVLRPDFLEHFRRLSEIFIDGRGRSLNASYFDELYARRADPWRLATRWYETRKRSITVACLPASRYERGLEIGCSIGLLTAQLAPLCTTLLAIDIAADALESARERLRESPHVSFACLDASVDFPAGQFDLIVISEVGYYLSRSDLIRLLATVQSRLAPGGSAVLCHWRHPVSDYPLGGDEVHDLMQATTTLTRTVRHDEADFILEVYGTDSTSVGQHEGLVP